MQSSEKKSYKLIWIAGASVAVFVVVLGATLVAVFQTSPKQEEALSSTPPTKQEKIATKEDVKSSMSKLEERLKQAAAARASVKASLDDSKNQIKVGS